MPVHSHYITSVIIVDEIAMKSDFHGPPRMNLNDFYFFAPVFIEFSTLECFCNTNSIPKRVSWAL